MYINMYQYIPRFAPMYVLCAKVDVSAFVGVNQ